jgi:hypothetical protein
MNDLSGKLYRLLMASKDAVSQDDLESEIAEFREALDDYIDQKIRAAVPCEILNSH